MTWVYRFVSETSHGFDTHMDGRHLPQSKGPWAPAQPNPIDLELMTEKNWEILGVKPEDLEDDLGLHGYHTSPKKESD